MKRLLALIALMLGMSALAVPAQARLAAVRECSQLPAGEAIAIPRPARFGSQGLPQPVGKPQTAADDRPLAIIRPALTRRAFLLSDRTRE